ncbi:hypothetical protein Syun_022846 [Stephania yunnanensis]|uniref:Uncharacterized protein n=1 Tax=Stephania yunnanensis TaxID=152371 RepID=A0AAP0FA83_9MAGN
MVSRDVTKTAWYHGHMGIHLLEGEARPTTPCRCASRGVIADETRNSVKEESGTSSSGGGVGRAAAVEDRGGEQGRRNRGRESAKHGAAEPCCWPMAADVWGQRRKQTNPRRKRGANRGVGGEDLAAAAAPDDKLV